MIKALPMAMLTANNAPWMMLSRISLPSCYLGRVEWLFLGVVFWPLGTVIVPIKGAFFPSLAFANFAVEAPELTHDCSPSYERGLGGLVKENLLVRAWRNSAIFGQTARCKASASSLKLGAFNSLTRISPIQQTHQGKCQ